MSKGPDLLGKLNNILGVVGGGVPGERFSLVQFIFIQKVTRYKPEEARRPSPPFPHQKKMGSFLSRIQRRSGNEGQDRWHDRAEMMLATAK